MDEKTVMKHIKALKWGKAADVYGLTCDHIKHAPPEFIQLITYLNNSIFTHCSMPDSFKIGALVPTHKKGKAIKKSR